MSTNHGLPKVTCMGHKFGPELMCVCGVSWGEHQRFLRACNAKHPKSTYATGGLGSLCRRHQVTHRVLAEHCSVTRETARRVLLGHPMVSAGMRRAVTAAAHELLRARGVDVEEVA